MEKVALSTARDAPALSLAALPSRNRPHITVLARVYQRQVGYHGRNRRSHKNSAGNPSSLLRRIPANRHPHPLPQALNCLLLFISMFSSSICHCFPFASSPCIIYLHSGSFGLSLLLVSHKFRVSSHYFLIHR